MRILVPYSPISLNNTLCVFRKDFIILKETLNAINKTVWFNQLEGMLLSDDSNYKKKKPWRTRLRTFLGMSCNRSVLLFIYYSYKSLQILAQQHDTLKETMQPIEQITSENSVHSQICEVEKKKL